MCIQVCKAEANRQEGNINLSTLSVPGAEV